MAQFLKNGYSVGQKSAWLGICSNIFLFLIKITAGIVGRSQAMIADAFHTASDVLTSICVLFGFKVASKPPDEHHPFGHGRAEAIAAKVVSLILILVGIKVVYDSSRILISGEMVEPGNIAIVAAVFSIIVKEITYRKVLSASKSINSISLKADAYHHRSDVLSSIAAIIGITAAKMGQTFMDPLAGIVVGGFIIKMGVGTFHEAYDELMDAAPPEELRNKISALAKNVPEVGRVKKIMVRKSGIELFVEITLCVQGDKTVEEGHLATIKVKREIYQAVPNVKDVIVHVEPC